MEFLREYPPAEATSGLSGPRKPLEWKKDAIVKLGLRILVVRRDRSQASLTTQVRFFNTFQQTEGEDILVATRTDKGCHILCG